MTKESRPLPLDVELDVIPDSYRISGTLAERIGRVSVRMLADRVLWIEVAGYQCTALLGRDSSLVIDPLGEQRAPVVADVLEGEFGSPVAAVAYSHWHSDHIGGTALIRDRSMRPSEFKIYAHADCAAEVQKRNRVPFVTHEVGEGVPFRFDGIEVSAHRVGGHTADHTAFLLPQHGVVHAVDLVHPAQAEYFRLGGAPDMGDYQRSLDSLLALNWRVLTAGHGQIGWRHDVELARDYASSLRDEVTRAIDEFSSEEAVPSTRPLEAVDRLRREVARIAGLRLLAHWAPSLPSLDLSVESHVFGMLESVLHHE